MTTRKSGWRSEQHDNKTTHDPAAQLQPIDKGNATGDGKRRESRHYSNSGTVERESARQGKKKKPPREK